MTKRLKLFLAIILGAMAIACCVAGCKIGQPGRDEILADYKGGNVVYYANGGCFNDTQSIVVRDIYYRDADVPFFNINESTEGIDVGYGNNDFIGWYLPATYESGERAGEIKYTYTYKNSSDEDVTVPAYLKLDEDGSIVLDKSNLRPVYYYEENGIRKDLSESQITMETSDTLVTTDRIIAADDKLVVCAKWKMAPKFVYKLVVDDGVECEANNKTYAKGDKIATLDFTKGKDTMSPGTTERVSFEGMTFVANYVDEACTDYAPIAYKRADYEEGAEVVVWAKYIVGSWTVIRNSAEDVRKMFGSLSDGNKAYYLLEDVDCSKQTFPYIRGGLNATIEGNGKTLSNLNFEVSNNTFSNGSDVAPVFGDIGASAQIKNLTLENITVSVKCNGSMTFHAICKSVAEGAQFENFNIVGITATVTLPGTVSNAQNGDESSWIFGGKGTDNDFLNAYSGITLTGNRQLTIKK